MSRGLYRVPAGCVGEDSDVVLFRNGQKFEMPRAQYDMCITTQAFEELPTFEEYSGRQHIGVALKNAVNALIAFGWLCLPLGHFCMDAIDLDLASVWL